MALNGIALSMTNIVKDITTSIYRKTYSRLLKVDFIRRNTKSIVTCLLVLVGLVFGSYVTLYEAAERVRNQFWETGSTKALSFADRIETALLERDILALNVAIGEREEDDFLLSIAVLDHEKRVVAHTDPEMINHPLTPLKNSSIVDTIKGVTVAEGMVGESQPALAFATPVKYAGVEIGSVRLTMAATDLNHVQRKYRSLFVVVVLCGLVVLAGLVVLFDRISVARALRMREERERTGRLGPYALKKKIAQGGMAEIFLADYMREDGFKRSVVVKRILEHLAENPEFIKMFSREARLAALLQHPNIVQVADFGKIQDVYFIAMEYVHGKNLGEIMAFAKGPLAVDQATYITLEISKGLFYSHSRKDSETGEPLGIVHRDVSPQNIMISFQGEVKITDFGISKAVSEPSQTQAGVIKGKLGYLSPEQALGKPIDHQADIYALGLVLYEMLVGQKAYRFSNEIEAIRSIPKVVISPPVSVRPEVPELLNQVVMKCLEKDKDARYQSAEELRSDLSRVRSTLHMTYDASELAEFMRKNFSS